MKHLFFLGFLLLACSLAAQPADRVEPGAFRVEPATLHSLGFEWEINGDANRNATVTLEYRRPGADAWRQGLPLLRLGGEPTGEPQWQYVTPPMFAGSLLDLDVGTAYECRLTLADPDGGQPVVKLLTLATRAEPRPAGGRQRHVYPEDWSGETEEPAYRGLLHAYYGYPRYADWILTTDPVQPGDEIVVHTGTYRADFTDYRDYHGLTFDGTYFLTQDGTPEQPIVIRAAGDGPVIFDGNDAAVLFDLTAADYHYFEGIHFQHTDVAIRAGLMNAYGADGLTVRHCTFRDIGIGIQAQYEGSRHFYIADNLFTGREDSTMVFHNKLENGRNVQRLASYYAVKLHGQGHDVCYNRIEYFFDGVDICTHARPEPDPERRSSAIDFYNNDIFICHDNFIEADGGTHNIRILRNRCFNSGQQALSNQPVLGGPVYWIRNLVYNCGDASTFKFWGMYPSGILAYHNTSSGILTRDDKPGSNVHLRNNLFLPSDEASQPTFGLYTYTAHSTYDYNGYRLRPDQPLAGWTEVPAETYPAVGELQRFASLEELRAETGQEQHGMLVDYDLFRQAKAPVFAAFREKHAALGKAYPIYYPRDFDFRLKPNAKAVDAGQVLPNVNDDFSGEGPDLGAYEGGKAVPHYGPRDKN